jgi:hypothetical protein
MDRKLHPRAKLTHRRREPMRHGQFFTWTLVVLPVFSFSRWGFNHFSRKRKGESVSPRVRDFATSVPAVLYHNQEGAERGPTGSPVELMPESQ